MTFEMVTVLGLTLALLIVLAFNLAQAEIALFGCVAACVFAGILSPEEAFKGFSNPGVITVGLLFIVSAAVKSAARLDFWVGKALGTGRKTKLAAPLLRMMFPITFLSAFLNNTPLVVIFTPVIKKWAEQMRLPVSKFLIPLSYAAIFGGWCTLLGTSTNLLSHGLMIANGYKGLSLFELAAVGVPCALGGILYMAFVGSRLLPDRKDVQAEVETTPKEYVIEMKVTERSPLAGKTIREAGLRNLKGLYLMEIERRGRALGPVSSREALEEGDRLVFVGVPSSVVDLQEMRGLAPAAHEMFERDFTRMRTHFIEAVISSSSPVLGKTVKECDFRKRYGAGVVAIHRNGERIREKIGSIRLKTGDTVLLFAGEEFVDRWRDSEDFYLVSQIKDRPPELAHKSVTTLAITILMVLAAAAGESVPGLRLNVLSAALGAVVLLIATKCIQIREAKRSIQWEVLLTIAFAIGFSRALEKSGAAGAVAGSMEGIASSFGPWGMLAAVYFLTVLFTEVLTNNAAVAIAFPIAVAVAGHLGVNPRPFMIAVTVAASGGFALPIGYQCHMIVQGPGGYKSSDFLRAGLLLDLLIGLLAVSLIPIFWAF